MKTPNLNHSIKAELSEAQRVLQDFLTSDKQLANMAKAIELMVNSISEGGKLVQTD